MKVLISFFIIATFLGCTSNKSAPIKSIDIPVVANKKLASMFADSRKINTSAVIDQLIKKSADDPNNPEPLFNLGYAHTQHFQSIKNIQEHDLAIEYFNEALSMVPGNQAVLNALYNIYYDDILNNRSSDAFIKAKDIFLQMNEKARETMNPPSLATFVHDAVAQDKQHQSDHQSLRETLLQAMQEQPKNDNVYIQLAKIFARDHYYSMALATLKSGAESIHDSAELYKAIATTYEDRSEVNGCNYEHTSDIVNASKYYKLAIPLQPEDQSLHYFLSRTLFDQNLNQLALNEINIVLSLGASGTNLSIAAQNYSMLGYSNKANQLLQQAMTKGFTKNDVAYHEIFMNQGDWLKAYDGFTSYIKTREKYNVYDLIKSDIITQQIGIPAWIPDKKISLSNDWEEQLFNYWSTKINADELKTFAHTSCEKTEYYFYTGYQDYHSGKVTQAKTKFAAVLDQHTYRFIERPLARYFLQK